MADQPWYKETVERESRTREVNRSYERSFYWFDMGLSWLYNTIRKNRTRGRYINKL